MRKDQYFLGVDIGGTKSHCLIADEIGNAIGFGQSGAGNWEMVGWDGLYQVLHECTHMALDDAGIQLADITGAGFGIAGYDWPEDREAVNRSVKSLEIDAPFSVVNDAVVGLLAGARAGWGVVIISGTGANCRGLDKEGREGRVTGMGSIYGEHGGAVGIVSRALLKVALAWSNRSPATKLSEGFLSLTGADDIDDMLAGIVRGRYQITPDAAPLVFQAAEESDQIAEGVIRWVADDLADMAMGVISQLDLAEEGFDVVLAGSTFEGNPLMKKIIEKNVKQIAPGARIVRLTAPPVVGGVLLGMGEIGISTAEAHPRLIESAVELINKKVAEA